MPTTRRRRPTPRILSLLPPPSSYVLIVASFAAVLDDDSQKPSEDERRHATRPGWPLSATRRPRRRGRDFPFLRRPVRRDNARRTSSCCESGYIIIFVPDQYLPPARSRAAGQQCDVLSHVPASAPAAREHANTDTQGTLPCSRPQTDTHAEDHPPRRYRAPQRRHAPQLQPHPAALYHRDHGLLERTRRRAAYAERRVHPLPQKR